MVSARADDYCIINIHWATFGLNHSHATLRQPMEALVRFQPRSQEEIVPWERGWLGLTIFQLYCLLACELRSGSWEAF